MIKQLLFDCGGVLTYMGFRDLMLQISGSEEKADYFFKRLWATGSPWHLYDKGELSEQETLTRLKKFMPSEYQQYLEPFLDEWLDALPPRYEMEEIIEKLQNNGLKCYLLSNFPKVFKEMPKRVPVLNKLNGMVISSDINLVKPDTAIFDYAAKTFNFKPQDTLFVDDTPANLVGAEKVGYHTYLFTEPQLFKEYLLQNKIL